MTTAVDKSPAYARLSAIVTAGDYPPLLHHALGHDPCNLAGCNRAASAVEGANMLALAATCLLAITPTDPSVCSHPSTEDVALHELKAEQAMCDLYPFLCKLFQPPVIVHPGDPAWKLVPTGDGDGL